MLLLQSCARSRIHDVPELFAVAQGGPDLIAFFRIFYKTRIFCITVERIGQAFASVLPAKKNHAG